MNQLERTMSKMRAHGEYAMMQLRCPAATGSIRTQGAGSAKTLPAPGAFSYSLSQVVVEDHDERHQRANRDNRISVHRPHPLSGMPPAQRSTAPRIVSQRPTRHLNQVL